MACVTSFEVFADILLSFHVRNKVLKCPCSGLRHKRTTFQDWTSNTKVMNESRRLQPPESAFVAGVAGRCLFRYHLGSPRRRLRYQRTGESLVSICDQGCCSFIATFCTSSHSVMVRKSAAGHEGTMLRLPYLHLYVMTQPASKFLRAAVW